MISKLNLFFVILLYDKWKLNIGDFGIYFFIYVFEILIVVIIFLICGLDKN